MVRRHFQRPMKLIFDTRYNKTFFARISLRLILCFFISCAFFHAAFIYSLYFKDDANCKAANLLYTYSSLIHCFLTTGLAVNLFIIFVLKKAVPEWAFAAYWVTALIAASSFCIPPLTFNSSGYSEIDGCWFKSPTTSWIYYYGPLFGMAVVNLFLGISTQVAMMAFNKKMDEELGSHNHTWSDPIESEISSKQQNQSSHGISSGSPITSVFGRKERTPKKTRKSGDELRSVALFVNLYVAIPFVCELATAITESLPQDQVGELGNFFQTLLVSSMGIFTFIIMCFDPTVKKSLRKAFSI
ncbi:hypothetical protein HDU97_002661 [Phlyctochytrium planicorne]|nr:hypothetical protein HDU97_002661 [Phlyctochytrium planicorne]